MKRTLVTAILFLNASYSLAITADEARKIPVESWPYTSPCTGKGTRDKCIGIDGGGQLCKPIRDPNCESGPKN